MKMSSKSKESTIRKLMKQVVEGDNIVPAIQSLATLDIPLPLATDLKVSETLTPLFGSPLLSGSIHEILKKLDGKKGKENSSGKSILKKKASIKRVSKGGSTRNRRSSGVTAKKVVEVTVEEKKEEETKPATRLFKKKEPKKKDSAMWKKINKVVPV